MFSFSMRNIFFHYIIYFLLEHQETNCICSALDFSSLAWKLEKQLSVMLFTVKSASHKGVIRQKLKILPGL